MTSSSDLSAEAEPAVPQAEEVPVQASAKLGPHPIPVLVPPVLVPPVSAPGSGSVRAADGSTITWTTAADGTVTAVGSAGRTMILQPLFPPTAAGIVIHAVQMAFAAPATGTYLTIDRSINETSRTVTIEYSGGESQITLTITLTGPDTGNATASGHYGPVPFSWSGPVSLSSNPVTTLAAKGFKSSAFATQIAEASYFAPATTILAGLPSGPVRRPVPVRKQARAATAEDEEGWGEFLGKAAVWGVLGAAAVVLSGGTILAVAVTGLAGAEASMASDEVTILAHQNQGIDPGPVPDPDPPPDPDDTSDPGVSDSRGDGDGDGDSDGDPGDEGGGGGCFAVGTLVTTEDGALLPIEAVKVDDILASRGELTRADGVRRVLRTWIHHDKKTIDLRLQTGETIRTTSVHRVFTVERGVLDVGSLRVGDHVETLYAGPQAIENIIPGPSAPTVYNLTVDDYHTYFVGRAGMWVHNEKDDNDDDGGDSDPEHAP
jgi:hypothetical protein